MHPSALRRPLACALFALCIASAAARAQAPRAGADTESTSGTDPANVAFRRGNEHAKAERWADAAGAYREAFRLRAAWDIASNLGIAELELDLPRDAAEHLDFSLRRIGATAKPEFKKLIEESLTKARAAVGTVNLRASAEGATVRVDGVTVGTSPLDAPVFMLPGTHKVEAVRGEESGVATVEIAAGEQKDIAIELKAGVRPGGDRIVPPVNAPEGKPLWPAILLGSGAAIGVGVGVGLTIAGGGARSDADDLVAEVVASGGSCSGNEASGPCAESRDTTSEGNTLRNVGVVGFVVGGLSAAGLVTYLLWPDDEPDAKQATTFTPFASPASRWPETAPTAVTVRRVIVARRLAQRRQASAASRAQALPEPLGALAQARAHQVRAAAAAAAHAGRTIARRPRTPVPPVVAAEAAAAAAHLEVAARLAARASASRCCGALSRWSSSPSRLETAATAVPAAPASKAGSERAAHCLGERARASAGKADAADGVAPAEGAPPGTPSRLRTSTRRARPPRVRA